MENIAVIIENACKFRDLQDFQDLNDDDLAKFFSGEECVSICQEFGAENTFDVAVDAALDLAKDNEEMC